jgi:hypothetical protein
MRLACGIGLIVDGVMVLRAEPPLVPTLLHSFSAGLGLLLLAALWTPSGSLQWEGPFALADPLADIGQRDGRIAEKDESQVLLQGAELGFAWSIAIDQQNSHMSATITDHTDASVLFSARWTAPQMEGSTRMAPTSARES